MITFEVTNQYIKLIDATSIGEILVSGTIGEYKCKFIFNEEWDGYAKTAIFMPLINNPNVCGQEEAKVYPVVLDENDECIIPYGALIAKNRIRIGIYGTTEITALPTIYSSAFIVRVGALPDNAAIEEDAGLYEQVLQKYAQILKLIEEIDVSVVPAGGEEGQVLTKKSEMDYDMDWQDVANPTWDEIQDKPEDLVFDDDYVHTDNNFTDGLKEKLENMKTDFNPDVGYRIVDGIMCIVWEE